MVSLCPRWQAYFLKQGSQASSSGRTGSVSDLRLRQGKRWPQKGTKDTKKDLWFLGSFCDSCAFLWPKSFLQIARFDLFECERSEPYGIGKMGFFDHTIKASQGSGR
jgi:hypothetical protein